jgi:hypothetical protein
MRACRPRSEFRAPDLDEDDRFAALCRELCHFEKFIGLFEAFDKTGNDPSIRIVQQIAGVIRKVEVCLVPLPTDSLPGRRLPERSHPNAAGLDDREIAGPIFAGGDLRGQP